MSFNIQKLNQGLSRIASVKNYPETQRPYISRTTKGRVFRIGVLHGKQLTENALLRNRRGYINAQVNTAAHAPSLYHWLFHRCGIPFEEAQSYVKHGKLKVDGVLVTQVGDLESQLDWSMLEQMDIQVLSSLEAVRRGSASSHSNNTEATSDAAAADGDVWVPALKRALHRRYQFIYMRPGVSVSSEEANPKSFVHRISSTMPAEAALGLNVLRPIGLIDGMRGLGIATNDVSVIRYWNNEFLGNYGVYDVRFMRGTPTEVVQRAAADMEKALATSVRPHIPASLSVPCSCSVGSVPSGSRDLVTPLFGPHTALHDQRLLVSTPLMPYRMVQRMKKAGGNVTLIRSGPFVLHSDLTKRNSAQARPLTTSELALFFTFERRLKTNRMILSLKEFDADKGDDHI